jgi:predicted dehydrogenase
VRSAHFPYLLASPHYEVVALCNSSVESAQAAVKRHGLSPSTKTYGSPEDMANDPDVDLVVCCVRVDRHYNLMMPSIKAGKDVFVEWPLASNFEQAEEMHDAAKKSGSKTIVGLQARPSPYVQKVKELVKNKAIGDLLSSNLTLEFGLPGDVEPPATDYMTKKEVGGNLLTILFGHTADSVFYALGGLEEASSLLTTRWPETKLLKADLSFDRMLKRETPDHIMLQGILTNNNAPISVTVRGGKGFKDTPNLTWRIFGTKGEIRLTSVTPLNIGFGGVKIELYDHEKDTVEVVEVQYSEVTKDLSPFAKNIGLLYELFAKGGSVEDGFVDFEQALAMQRIIDRMEKSSEGRKYENMKM